MFGFIRKGAHPIEEKIRDLLPNLVSAGCLIILMSERRVNNVQMFMLTQYLSRLSGQEDLKAIVLGLTDQLAIMDNPKVLGQMGNLLEEARELPELILSEAMEQVCICAELDEQGLEYGQKFVVAFCKLIGLTYKKTGSVLRSAHVLALGYESFDIPEEISECRTILQKALSRVQFDVKEIYQHGNLHQ